MDGKTSPSLSLDATLPSIRSEILSIWRRSSQAEGNPFHKCFTRISLGASGPPKSTTTEANVDPAIPLETCRNENLIMLPSGRVAVPLLQDGLSDSFDWHRDQQVTARLTLSQPTDRSILIQTTEHLADLSATFPALKDSFEAPSSFGQNLLISGELTAKTLCIGDVLNIVRSGVNGAPDEMVGILQVSNPRLPCFKVDYKHQTSQPGEPAAALTVRGYCASSGRAGFFCRVLQTGSLAVADRIVLAQRFLPQWTLAGISELMYGGVNAKQAELRVWRGTEDQLRELMELKLLGWFEWRHALHKFFEKRARLAGEACAKDEKSTKETAVTVNSKHPKIAWLLSIAVPLGIVTLSVCVWLFFGTVRFLA